MWFILCIVLCSQSVWTEAKKCKEYSAPEIKNNTQLDQVFCPSFFTRTNKRKAQTLVITRLFFVFSTWVLGTESRSWMDHRPIVLFFASIKQVMLLASNTTRATAAAFLWTSRWMTDISIRRKDECICSKQEIVISQFSIRVTMKTRQNLSVSNRHLWAD